MLFWKSSISNISERIRDKCMIFLISIKYSSLSQRSMCYMYLTKICDIDTLLFLELKYTPVVLMFSK